MANRSRLEELSCPLSTTVQHIGEWWTLLILHDAFDGCTRFDEFQRNLGISSSMLTTRLKTLADDGLLERRQYQTNPPRYEYVLTELGRTLRPVIVTLAAWGNERLAPDERTMILVDVETGSEVEPAGVEQSTGPTVDGPATASPADPRPAVAMRGTLSKRSGDEQDAASTTP
jgi:DNA-binding HxlR family transcriptional regulator